MPQEFYQRVPGERSDQVERRARHLSKQAGQFEKQVEFTAAGDVNVDPRMMLSLSGTGTAWDQSYFIHAVTFIFDQPEGASNYGGSTMTIEARNMDSSNPDASPGADDGTTTAPGGGDEGDGAAPLQSSQGFDEAGFE